MSAIDNFRNVIQRAEAMVALHKELCPRGKPRAEHADLLRAAVVIAVSGMDGYFHERIPESIARFVRAEKGRNLPGKLVDLIKAAASHDRLIEILFEERPLSHIATMVRKSMADRTYQDVGKIEDVLKILGVQDLWFKMAQSLNVSKEKARMHVQPYVERSHQIVHRGDFGQNKKTKNQLQPIARPYAERCVREIRRFVEEIDKVVETALASQEQKK